MPIFFDLQNLYSILIISIYFFLISFSLYLPLLACTRNKNDSLKFAIPVSLSFMIIFGYFFYSIRTISLFPTTYYCTIIFVNAISFLKIKKEKIPFLTENFSFKKLFFLLILLIPITYTRFYDSLNTSAPGNPDTYAHIEYLNILKSFSVLGMSYYAPGFHIVLYPLSLFLTNSELYRFLGPVLGLVVFLSIYLLFRNSFEKKYSRILLILLFCLPIFNLLILQTISFWPSSLSFIFFTSFIYLFFTHKKISKRKNLLLFLLFSITLSITLPYLYTQLIPAIILLLLLSLFIGKTKENYDNTYTRYILSLFTISIIGLFVAFGHVFLQTQIISKDDKFPEITKTSEENGALIIKSNRETSPEMTHLIKRYPPLESITNNTFFKNNVLPIYMTGRDLLEPKGLRSATNILSSKTYVWILISILGIFYAIRKKDKILLTIFSFSIVFGLSAQTGIMELSTYRGRVGWYVLLLSLFGIVFIFDKFYQNKYEKIIKYIIIPILFFYSLTNPPVFQRISCNDDSDLTYALAKKNTNEIITIISTQPQLSIISDNVKIIPLDIASLKMVAINPTSSTNFIILRNNFCSSLPENFEKALSTDESYKNAQKQKMEWQQAEIKTNENLKSSELFSSYSKIFENKNISVYQKN